MLPMSDKSLGFIGSLIVGYNMVCLDYSGPNCPFRGLHVFISGCFFYMYLLVDVFSIIIRPVFVAEFKKPYLVLRAQNIFHA